MEEMTLRVPVAVKAKVTEDLKAKIVSDLETRLSAAALGLFVLLNVSSPFSVCLVSVIRLFPHRFPFLPLH